MPHTWADWVHAIITTYGTWLPGDPRGFRDHGHRVHSSGDYKSPPPAGEHAGLLDRSRRAVKSKIVLPPEHRQAVAGSLVSKLDELGHPVRILAVNATHVHLMVRVGQRDAKPVIGLAKQRASLDARSWLQGGLWAQGCHLVRVFSDEHYHTLIRYIAEHADEGAFVWVHPTCRRAESGDPI